ncbi:MAG TPA: porin family protein [Puia sp.]|jgi:hypothetical protein
MTSSIKRKSIVLSFFLLALATSSFAQLQLQSVQIGAKAGGNFYKFSKDTRSFDNKTYPSFSAGAYAELNFTPKWSLQPELLWSETIGQTGDQFNQIYGGLGAISSKIFLNYISVPVLVAFKPVPELSILLGPQYGYLISQTTGLVQGRDAFSKSDLSITGGAQLNLGKIKFGLRYSGSVISINGINNSDSWKPHGFQMYLGYQLWDLKVKKKK